MHTAKRNKLSIYFVKRNNWVTPADWVNNTEIYRYSWLDWSDFAENNFDTQCIKVDGWFLVLLKRSRRIWFSFFEKFYLLDDHFENPRISLRTSTTMYFKLVASTVCMIGFQEIHEAFFEVFPMPHPRKVHFYRYCKPVILRLKLNSSQGAFKNLFCNFAATFGDIWMKCPSEWICFYKNTSLFKKQFVKIKFRPRHKEAMK